MAPTDPGDVNPHASPEENERFAAFRAYLESEGLSPITCACYASDWWNLAERVRGAKHRRFSLDRFTPDDFRTYRADAAARSVSAATLNRRLAFVRRYAKFAAASDPRLAHLVEEFSSVAFQPVRRPVAGALTRDAEERLVDAARRAGPTDLAFVLVLVRTGIRSGEALALTRGDVSGPEGLPTAVRVRGAREKTVRLPPMTSRAIGELIASEPGVPSDPLFRVRGRYALGRSAAAALVTRCARSAGIRANFRTLRHTFAVRYLAEHRDDLDGLADAMGRTSPALIEAWRTEAGPETREPQLVAWSDAGDEDAAVRRVRGASVEGVLEEHAPGVTREAPPEQRERLLFVVAGSVSIRTASRAFDAQAGDVVRIPAGARFEIAGIARATTLAIAVHRAG